MPRTLKKLKIKYTAIPAVLLLVFLSQYTSKPNSNFICHFGNSILLAGHQISDTEGFVERDSPCLTTKNIAVNVKYQNKQERKSDVNTQNKRPYLKLGHTKESVALQENSVLYRHSICVIYRGRLGNNMFQYAASFGIGQDKNMSIAVSLQDRLSQIFQLPSAKKVRNRHHCAHAKIVSEKIHCAYDPTVLNFTNKQDVSLIDYLQSWKYFAQHAEQLRREFTFQKNITEQANHTFSALTKQYVSKNCTFIGLHIRRGDIARFKSLSKRGYTTAPKSYIYKAVAYFKSRFKNAVFLVSTDDPIWVENHYFKYSDLLKFHMIGKHSAEVDLAILSLCDHMIMSTGTFSWWAGWLSGGTTVYYKYHIKEKSRLRKQFSKDYSDYFYPTWIGLD